MFLIIHFTILFDIFFIFGNFPATASGLIYQLMAPAAREGLQQAEGNLHIRKVARASQNSIGQNSRIENPISYYG
jgi:hypothetical protein